MFDMDGQVIGINTAIYSPSGGSIGIGFAIPSALAKPVVAELENEADHTVHRGWLGVRIQEVTDEIAESLGLDKARGALVASVSDKGPAQVSGIQPGDVILSFDGKNVGDMRHLPRLVAETPVDKTVSVTLWRKHAQTTVRVRVAKLDESDQRVASAQDVPKKTARGDATVVRTLGLTLSGITPDLKDKYSLGNDAKGVVVVDVAKNSLAAEHSIPLTQTVAVGDGANDLPMLAAAGLGVAFRAKPAVAAVARWRLDHADLTGLLYAQGYRKEEFAA